MRVLSRVLVASVGLAWLCIGSNLRAEEIRVGGTGSATKLLHVLGEAFGGERRIGFDVVPSLGSTGGLRALADGVLDLAVVARPLKPEEEAKGLRVVLHLQTPFLFVTSRKGPAALAMADIIAAHASGTARWSDGTPIKIILRPRAESDTLLMVQMFRGLGPALESARRRGDVPIAATDQDSADMAEQVPGSLVGISMTQLLLEKRNLQAIAIDGVEPTFANFAGGTYPYAKPLYVVVGRQTNPALESFVAYLRSPAGTAALRAAHLL